MSNTVAQNCTPNQINKNNLRLNQLNRTKEAYGRYRNVFLEDYSELEMEIAELIPLIDDLSIYMQSTGREVRRPCGDPCAVGRHGRKTTETGSRHPDHTLQQGGKFMTETIQTAMDRLMTISVEPQDYVAEDGLLYCGSCNTHGRAFFPNGRKLFGRDRHPAECQCRQEEKKQEEEERARLHHENVRRLKLQGFTDWAMQHWTFENDHGQNPQMHLAQRYVDYWPKCGKECGAAALGRCWYRQEFYGGLHCQCPDGTGSGRLHDEFCPNYE